MACHCCPDLILMDISLSGSMDGVAAAEAIRCRQDVPVVYLTAHSDSATLARAKITDPFGYLLKPFEERELATQVELALFKHQSERQLREQREWLRVTLRSIGDAVIATDAAGRVTFLNPASEALTGWDAKEAAGQPIEHVFRIVNERTGEPLPEPVARVLRECRAVELANHAALVKKDGRTVPIEDSAAPILDAAGELIGVVLVFHEVTAKRRAAENRALLQEVLQILNQGCDFHAVIAETLRAIRGATGFDAVGLRLRQGDDCPYFENDGFSEQFVEGESFLCHRSASGEVVHDENGCAVLECTCGMVLSGKTTPSLPFCSPGGSCWTNASQELLTLSRSADPRITPRNRCVHEGYESIGLFPVRRGARLSAYCK